MVDQEVMRRRLRALQGPSNTLLCLALLIVPASAQDPSQELDELLIERVKQKLASDVAGDVAWGGYLAQRYRLKSADRALLEALGKWRDRDGIEARVVRLHLVDGLVGVRAQVAAEQVEFLLEDPLTRDAAFGLLVGRPVLNREAILRAAMAPAEKDDPVRQLAAEVIVNGEMHSPEYVQFLLSNLKCTLTVNVEDANAESIGRYYGVGFGGKGTAMRRLRGFPPLVQLWMGSQSNTQESIHFALVGNRTSVVISRRESLVAATVKLSRGDLVPPEWAHVESTLARMADQELATWKRHRHDWVDAATFTQAALAARAARIEELDAFVDKLRKRRWLGPDDLPGYRIPLEVKIDDHRSDKTVPLPELPPIPRPAGVGDGR